MADSGGNVRVSPPPPRAVLRIVNTVVRPLLASRLGRRINGLMLLEFRGRRSGRRMRIPVTLHLVDGVPMAFTDAPWRHSFTGGARVLVTHRGRVHDTVGTLVPMTPQEMGEAVRKALDSGSSARQMGIRAAAGHEVTATELATLGPALGTSVIRFDFRPAPAL